MNMTKRKIEQNVYNDYFNKESENIINTQLFNTFVKEVLGYNSLYHIYDFASWNNLSIRSYIAWRYGLLFNEDFSKITRTSFTNVFYKIEEIEPEGGVRGKVGGLTYTSFDLLLKSYSYPHHSKIFVKTIEFDINTQSFNVVKSEEIIINE